eukprot:TRINITY_DN15251_c0_g1_i1.p1 TRINITY_DN15251_c0_g1~~TRINITY_DN15251_c0_g1_i1.p1  ORF type:complete len:228 (+),score=37.16 TRINITY_DN15251_c0_g1_i1:74-757(+)
MSSHRNSEILQLSARSSSEPTPIKQKKWWDRLKNDKISLVVLGFHIVTWGVILAGLVVYFRQYSWSQDQSDESWLFPFIWFFVTLGFVFGFIATALHSLEYKKMPVTLFPIALAFHIIFLCFLCFIFFRASDSPTMTVCSYLPKIQDQNCIVLKSGGQLCGHVAIQSLCVQLVVGFYLVFFGSIVMIATEILFIVMLCIRRVHKSSKRAETRKLLGRGKSIQNDDLP